jgi:hypothetical protein
LPAASSVVASQPRITDGAQLATIIITPAPISRLFSGFSCSLVAPAVASHWITMISPTTVVSTAGEVSGWM